MKLEEIKNDVIKAIECDTETMPDYYYDMDMGNHIKTLAADIAYLLSIIEQQDKTLELIANGNNEFPAWEDTIDILKDVRLIAKEAIRGN